MRRWARWSRFLLFLISIALATLAFSGGASAYSSEAGAGEEAEGAAHGPSPIYRYINFVILVGGLAFVLRKPLGHFFSERSDTIRKNLEEGRQALDAAQEKLNVVEQKLQHFEEEIAVFRADALKEMEEERSRLRQATAQEAERMMESVRVQMDVAGKQARLELRLYAAEQAVMIAERVIAQRMDSARQKRLVIQFVEKLGAETRNS